MIIRFELAADPKSKVDASKFFEIVPKQGSLPAGGDRNAQATSVTVSHWSGAHGDIHSFPLEDYLQTNF